MNILKKLHTFWHKLTFLGVNSDLSVGDTIKTRLLNIVLFIGIVILSLLWIRAAIVQEVGQFVIISSMFFVLFGILYLNVTNRQNIAQLIIVFGVTLPITATLILIHPSPWELEYIYLMVIFVSLIFFQGRKQKMIIFFVVSMFICAYIVEPRFPMEYKFMVPLTPNLPLFLFIFFVLYSTIVLTFYQTEIKKYQDAQKETILALQDSNEKLQSTSEELERFIYIVSSDLKSRLKKVGQYIKKVRKKVSEHQFEEISSPLNSAENKARQMHFWVNDVLEFSTVSNSGKRLEEKISFDELFTSVKMNLSKDDDDDFENRILWTSIPDVRLNELEAFIVFYNIVKIALHTTYSKVNINASITDDYLQVRFVTSKNNLEKEDEKIKFCELIVKGWNGEINLIQKEKKVVYEINIPKDKLLPNND